MLLENIDLLTIACGLQIIELTFFVVLLLKICVFYIRHKDTLNAKILTYITFALIAAASNVTSFTKKGASLHIIISLVSFVSFQVFLYESIQIDKSNDVTTSEVINLQKQYNRYNALVYLFSTITAYIAAICIPLLVLQFNAIDLKNLFAAIALFFVVVYCCILVISVKKRKSIYIIGLIYALTMFILLLGRAVLDNFVVLPFIKNYFKFLETLLYFRAANLAALVLMILQKDDLEAFND